METLSELFINPPSAQCSFIGHIFTPFIELRKQYMPP